MDAGAADHFLEVELDRARYALPIASVVEVVPRVWTTPLAGAPPDVEGVFAFRGDLSVAVDLRGRLGHPTRAATLSDHLVVLDGRSPRLALVVDRAVGVRAIDLARLDPPPAPHARLAGVLVLGDGLLLAVDVAAMLSTEERRALDDALAEPA